MWCKSCVHAPCTHAPRCESGLGSDSASGPGLASIRGAEEDPGPEAAGILAEGRTVQWLVTIGMRILNLL